jgi:hypothetical protein
MLPIITIVCCVMIVHTRIGGISSSIACSAHGSGIICKFLGSRGTHLHHSLLLGKPSGDLALLK